MTNRQLKLLIPEAIKPRYCCSSTEIWTTGLRTSVMNGLRLSQLLGCIAASITSNCSSVASADCEFKSSSQFYRCSHSMVMYEVKSIESNIVTLRQIYTVQISPNLCFYVVFPLSIILKRRQLLNQLTRVDFVFLEHLHGGISFLFLQ